MAITIPQNDRIKLYEATAGQTTFAYDFSIYDSSEILVIQVVKTTGVVNILPYPAGYSLTGIGNENGGNVTLTVAAAVDDVIAVLGNTPELRNTNYTAAGDFSKESINTAFNKIIQMVQQLRRDADRSLRLEDYDTTDISAVSLKIPNLDERKGQYLYFDEADGGVDVRPAVGVEGPADSVNNEVALFADNTGQTLKRPGTSFMIMPQGSTAQRGAPGSIVLRGNTDGTEDVEAYINGAWQSVLTGGTGAPINATYIVQQPSGALTNEQAMSALATGIVKNATATGVQSIAVEGVDYYAPGLTNVAIVDGGTGASTAADARTNLGLEIGTDVQAFDQNLQDISDLAPPGADRILFYDQSAGTIDYLNPGTGVEITGTTLSSLLSDDPDPNLAGNLNVNGFDIVDTNDNELFTFTETALAVNNLNIANAATGNDVVVSAVGFDANVGININAKGTGTIALGNYDFDVDQTVGAGQDDYILTYDNGTGLISLEAAAAGGLTNPLTADINMNGFGLDDTNNNELVTFTEVASAVNNLNIANAATGNAISLSAIGGDTNIDIDIIAKGTGNISLGNFNFDADQTVGAGQDDYVLTYDNAGGLIRLEAATGGGSMSLITTSTPAGVSSVDFTGLSNTFSKYIIILENVSHTGTLIQIRFSDDNGASFISANYDFANMRAASNAASVSLNSSTAATSTRLNFDSPISGNIEIFNADTANFCHILYQTCGETSNFASEYGAAFNSATNNIDAIRIFSDTGTITGTLKLYGVS